jgi:hypothetical protein
MLGSATIAQSDTTTISIPVLPYNCQPANSMSIDATSSGSSSIAPQQPQSGTNTFDWNLNFYFTIRDAGCNQWTVTAQLSSFKLDTDSTKTFPGTTLHIARDSSIPDSSQGRWTSQPAWVQNLPANLPIGNPTMPAPLAQTAGIFPSLANSVSFTGTPATSTTPLLKSSTAQYGSPGNMTTYYRMRLFDLPTDLYLNPGNYSADITISVQGAD